ncbi:hypothetical protein RRG08_066331 [Elysia crispata]|uniref:Fucolectin tachylectin-4 pentraxin-1 domain-containing protein n=1 Tax=Elysia crispata TaxID=231223 RepID=A0AAE1B0A8_9GAST|nr:hypothetical protein RRG08_066331 [Elysia crispata]
MNSLNVLARVLLLASVLYVITEARTQCEDDWFGPDCQYQCHCVGSAPCNKHDGSCSSGCHRDWFGPACQYSKMAFRVYNQNLREMRWLTDSNDTTCNKWEHSTLSVALNTAIPLSWIRVVVKDTVKNFTIFLKFKDSNQTLKCGSSAIVDDRTYDIVCNTHDLVKDFYLSGAGVKSLCSLYISAGRNVALKQQTEQSSTYKTWISSHAVDGKLDIPDNEDSQKATCTRTKWRDPGWWRLTFSQPANVSMFSIYNRRNPSWKYCCEQRLKGFHLTALDSQKVLLYEYIDQETERADMYIVRPHSMIKNVRVVQIEKGHPNWYLALCEVKVFGELSCGDGRYGLGCERRCNCVNQASCFVHSGGCPSGCAAGYIGEDCSVCLTGRYGSGCAEICSEKCGGDGNLCEQSGGACNQGCDPGYAGTHCQFLCPNGKYGPGCSESCNTECGGLTNACHHINGTCSYGCDAGYRGSMCDTECEAGSYGTGCLRLCSPHCAGTDRACHHVNGKCDKVGTVLQAVIRGSEEKSVIRHVKEATTVNNVTRPAAQIVHLPLATMSTGLVSMAVTKATLVLYVLRNVLLGNTETDV